MRTRYNADYFMFPTPDRIKYLTNKIKVILNESNTYRNKGYICSSAEWIIISGKAHYDENNNETSFEFKLFGSERTDPADGCSVCLSWIELDESKLDKQQRSKYLKLRDEINAQLDDPKTQEWQQIINNEYKKCIRKHADTADILEGLERQKNMEKKISLIAECFDVLFETFGDRDPVTTRRMSDYFNKPTQAMQVGHYIFCKTTDHGYVVLDSNYRLINLPSPVVFCQNDLFQNVEYSSNFCNLGWYKELIKYSNSAYELLSKRNKAGNSNTKTNTRSGK